MLPTDLKLTEHPGISKTVPTLRFLPSQIYEVGDVLADGAEEATSFNDPQYGFPQGADLPEKSVMNDVGLLRTDRGRTSVLICLDRVVLVCLWRLRGWSGRL